MSDSPCIQVCRIDPETGLCLGCFRTPAEVMAWDRASDGERLATLAAATRRRRVQDPWQNDLRCDCDD